MNSCNGLFFDSSFLFCCLRCKKQTLNRLGDRNCHNECQVHIPSKGWIANKSLCIGNRNVWRACVCACVCVCDIISYITLLIILQELLNLSSVTQSCPTLCDPMNSSTPGLPVHHQLPEPTQTHVHWVGDAIQPSHPLSSPSPPALNLFQNQGLFQGVSSLHQVAKVLEFQLQHQTFQCTPRTDLL